MKYMRIKDTVGNETNKSIKIQLNAPFHDRRDSIIT